jgi:heme/copper-type cytochrome/quinol oxidase subunit 2
MRRLIPIVLLAALLASCGADVATTTTGATPTSTTTTVVETTTTLAPVTTTSAQTTTTANAVDVTVTDGVVDGPDLFEFALGDQVEITVLTDVADEIHVHGYDIRYDAQPGIPVEISFEADAPGIFEVELEANHLLLFEIQVSP